MLFRTNSYAPHVLHAVRARLGSGRRRRTYTSLPNMLWYTTFAVHSGTVELIDHGRHRRVSAPAVMTLQPGSATQIVLPIACEYGWIDWGVTAAKRIARNKEGAALRYVSRQAQPSSETVWDCPWPETLPEPLVDSSMSMIDRIISHWYGGAIGQATADAHLALWLVQVLTHLKPTRPPSAWLDKQSDSRGKYFAVLAWQNLSGITNISQWAAVAGLGRHQLNRVIQQDCGVTATHALDLIRLDVLKAYLHASPHIAEVASKLGFTNTTSFSRWFKRHHGLAPTEYLQQAN